MNPKRAAEHIRPTAEDTDMSENLVKDLTSFYWKDVRECLTHLKYPNVYISNLGVFKCKHWDLQKFADKYEEMIAHYTKVAETKLTVQKFAVQKDFEAKLEMVKNMQALVADELNKKKKVKQLRDDKKTKNNLEKP